jgi:hypothetical protein
VTPELAAIPNGAVVSHLNWFWITIAIVVPPLLALIVAALLWRTGQVTLGSVFGTAIIFAFGIGLILREYVELDHVTQACLEAGTTCFPQPPAFTRFAIYASIAMVDVFGLFTLGLKIDERVRNRGYAKEWRR